MNDFIVRRGRKLYESATGREFRITGVNLAETVGVDPFERDNEPDIALISDLGLSAARIHMEYTWFEDDDRPYVWKQSGFGLLRRYIERGKRHGVRMILDMQFPQSGFQATEKAGFWDPDNDLQNRYVALWKAIAEEMKDEDFVLCYDLLNEPVFKEGADVEPYVSLLQRVIREIRSVDTHHLLWVELPLIIPFVDLQPSKRRGLKPDFSSRPVYVPPVNDENIIYDSHMYYPLDFTHQETREPVFSRHPPRVRGLGWMDLTESFRAAPPPRFSAPQTYPSAEHPREEVIGFIARFADAAHRSGYPFVCGEYGVNRNALGRGGVEWVRDATDYFDRSDIHYCYFSMGWKAEGKDFGFFRESLTDVFRGRYDSPAGAPE